MCRSQQPVPENEINVTPIIEQVAKLLEENFDVTYTERNRQAIARICITFADLFK
jgi:hypothetical protein